MKAFNLSTGVYVTLVFLSGSVVGAFSHRLYTLNSVTAASNRRSPEEFRKKYLGEIQSRLTLNPDQVAKVNEILDNTNRRYKELRDRSAPEMKTIQDEQVESVNAILSVQQRAEYQKFREERNKRRHDQHTSGIPPSR